MLELVSSSTSWCTASNQLMKPCQRGLNFIIILKVSYLASTGCRKTKTKVFTMANENKRKYSIKPMRNQSDNNQTALKMRENASDQVVIALA